MKKLYILHIFQALILLLLILTLVFNVLMYIYQVPDMEIEQLDWENYQYYCYREFGSSSVLPYYKQYIDYDIDYQYWDIGVAKIPAPFNVSSKTKKFSFEGIDYSFKLEKLQYLNLCEAPEKNTPLRDTEFALYSFGEEHYTMSLFGNTVLHSLYVPASDKFESLSEPERQTEELAWKYLREGIGGYTLMALEDENAKFKLVTDLTELSFGEYPYYDVEKILASRDKYEYIFVKYINDMITPEWIFMGFSENGQLLRYKRSQVVGVLTSEQTDIIGNVSNRLLRRLEYSGYNFSYYGELKITDVCLCMDLLGRRYFLYTVNYRADAPDLYAKVFIDEAVITDSYPLDKFIKTELILGAITVGFTLICGVTNILISKRKKSTPIPTEEEQTE